MNRARKRSTADAVDSDLTATEASGQVIEQSSLKSLLDSSVVQWPAMIFVREIDVGALVEEELDEIYEAAAENVLHRNTGDISTRYKRVTKDRKRHTEVRLCQVGSSCVSN